MKSTKWYKEQVRTLFTKVTPQGLMHDQTRLTNKIKVGQLYLFSYTAKHKDTLPYYDMFPLVLPFRPLNDGFIGLNFHYLPYAMRTLLMNRLMQFTNNKLMNENTKIQVSWRLLKGAANHPAVAPCVHRYLYTQVNSRFLTIQANEWSTAIMLPVESFQGATKNKVWADSKKKMS